MGDRRSLPIVFGQCALLYIVTEYTISESEASNDLDYHLEDRAGKATDGDIITLPAGSYTISDYHVWNKALTLRGQGRETRLYRDTEEDFALGLAGDRGDHTTYLEEKHLEGDYELHLNDVSGLSFGGDDPSTLIVTPAGEQYPGDGLASDQTGLAGSFKAKFDIVRCRTHWGGGVIELDEALTNTYESGAEVVELDMLNGAEIRDMRFTSDNDGGGSDDKDSFCIMQMVEGGVYENVQVSEFDEAAFEAYTSRDMLWDNCKAYNSSADGSGAGEPFKLYRVANATVRDCEVRNTRRGIDLPGFSHDVYVRGFTAQRVQQGCIATHKTDGVGFNKNVTIEGAELVGDRNNSSGDLIAVQGENVNITDVSGAYRVNGISITDDDARDYNVSNVSLRPLDGNANSAIFMDSGHNVQMENVYITLDDGDGNRLDTNNPPIYLEADTKIQDVSLDVQIDNAFSWTMKLAPLNANIENLSVSGTVRPHQNQGTAIVLDDGSGAFRGVDFSVDVLSGQEGGANFDKAYDLGYAGDTTGDVRGVRVHDAVMNVNNTALTTTTRVKSLSVVGCQTNQDFDTSGAVNAATAGNLTGVNI